MSNDLISRSALARAIQTECNPYGKPTIDYESGLKVLNIINNAPTVEERPHGEWEEPFEHKGKTYHKCTRCHISTQLMLTDSFCPNCGADMRKE